MLASDARARARRGALPLLAFVGRSLGAAAVCAGCVLSFDGLTGGARPGDDAGSAGTADGASPGKGGDGGAADVETPDTGAIFSDTFDGPSIDLSKWNAPRVYTSSIDPAVMVDIAAQRLRIRLLSSTGGVHYSGVTTKLAHDLTGARVSVRLAVLPEGEAGAVMTLALGRLSDGSAYAAIVEGGTIRVLECVPGECDAPTSVVGAVQNDTRIAIRHDIATDEVVWEIAPPTADGPPSWSELHRRKPTTSLASSLIELSAGTYTNVPNAGVAAFDDVLVER